MMWWTLALALFAVIGMLLCLALFPDWKIGKISLPTFWIPPFLVAIILLATRLEDFTYFWSYLTSDSSINPLEILVLFISMAFISTVLDEAGFFSFLASRAVSLGKGSQFSVFIILYVLTSILTIFTSNDIIILTFTPFLIYFSKNAKVDPVPYLVGEFVAANTWSLLFLIGNPTNIYLGTSFNLTFFSYLQAMWLPTLLAGVSSFLIMLLLFYKKLKKPFESAELHETIKGPYFMWASLSCLIVCLFMMVFSSFWNIPLWLISGASAVALLLFCAIYSLFQHDRAPMLGHSIARLPYQVIPFVLAMFVIVLSLKETGWTKQVATLLASGNEIWTYGFSSLLMSNLINNIPMSVFYTEIIKDGGASASAVYASIIGSNIGAFLTPVGALAGVMWMSILKQHDIRFSFLDFVKYGLLVGLPSMALSLLGLLA
jgi:arsenical pump membrane protein